MLEYPSSNNVHETSTPSAVRGPPNHLRHAPVPVLSGTQAEATARTWTASEGAVSDRWPSSKPLNVTGTCVAFVRQRPNHLRQVPPPRSGTHAAPGRGKTIASEGPAIR